jgi:tetratricopeptide (TPR) repeat protein
MSYIRKRIPKKKTSDPDELISYSQRLLDSAREHVNMIIYAGGAIVFVAVIAFGMMWMKGNREAAAQAALSNAVNLYNLSLQTEEPSEGEEIKDPDLTMALESFQEVAAEYEGTSQGKAARFYTVNLLFRMGRLQEAAEAARSFIVMDPEFADRVNGGILLARILEATEQYPEAAEIYNRNVAKNQGDLKATLMMDAARCYELSGDRDRAVDLYRAVVKEFEETGFSVRADTKLAILGVRADPSL